MNFMACTENATSNSLFASGKGKMRVWFLRNFSESVELNIQSELYSKLIFFAFSGPPYQHVWIHYVVWGSNWSSSWLPV